MRNKFAIVSFAAKPTAKPVIPKPATSEVIEYPWFCKIVASAKNIINAFKILLNIGENFKILVF